MSKDSEIIRPMVWYRAKRESQKVRARGLSAASAIGQIDKDRGFTCLTNGAFSMIDAVRHVLSQTGPAAVLVTTWVPGSQEIADLVDLKAESKVITCRAIVDTGFAAYKVNRARFLVESLGKGNVVETRNHSKVAVIRNDQWAYCLRGSLNLNGNFRCENLDGDNSPELCDVIEGWFDELVEKSGGGLWLPPSETYQHYIDTMAAGVRRGKGRDVDEFDQEIGAILAKLGNG